MKLTTFAGALIMSFAPGALLADMSYSNFEVGYADIDLDGSFGNVDGDGYALGGSYAVNESVFVFGEMQDQSFDFDVDGTSYELGLGFAHGFNPDLDFVGSLSYVDTELEFGGFSVDDDGYAIGAGIRSRVASAVELDAGLRFIDMNQAGSDTGLRLKGRYYFADTMAVSLGTDLDDAADTLRLGFRAEF